MPSSTYSLAGLERFTKVSKNISLKIGFLTKAHGYKEKVYHVYKFKGGNVTFVNITLIQSMMDLLLKVYGPMVLGNSWYFP